MTDLTVAEATSNIYASIRDDNRDLDDHIAVLKGALAREGQPHAIFDVAQLAQPNRAGRKLLQAYFRQKGISVKFEG